MDIEFIRITKKAYDHLLPVIRHSLYRRDIGLNRSEYYYIGNDWDYDKLRLRYCD